MKHEFLPVNNARALSFLKASKESKSVVICRAFYEDYPVTGLVCVPFFEYRELVMIYINSQGLPKQISEVLVPDDFMPNLNDLEVRNPEIVKAVTDSFEKASEPLIKYLNQNHHPHVKVIVTNTGAELLEGIKGFENDKYLRD